MNRKKRVGGAAGGPLALANSKKTKSTAKNKQCFKNFEELYVALNVSC